MITDIVFGVGGLSIAGFGVWRGQTLWSRHIELKHEREVFKLEMKRREKAVRLEIEQTRSLAEIESMNEVPALPSSTGDLSRLPFVCGCDQHPSWHMHASHNLDGGDRVFPLSLGAIQAICAGKFVEVCVCDGKNHNPGSAHHHQGGDPKVTVQQAGYMVRR